MHLSDYIGPDTLGNIIYSLIALGAILGGLRWIARPLRRFEDAAKRLEDPRWTNMLDDWAGREKRPGYPRQPGIPERLEETERRQDAFESALARVTSIEKAVTENTATIAKLLTEWPTRDEVKRLRSSVDESLRVLRDDLRRHVDAEPGDGPGFG